MKGYYSNTAKDNSEFYVGSAIYQTDTTVGNPTLSQLKYMKTDEGCFSQQKDGYFAHEYMIKDHLGNTRVLFGDYNGNDSIEASEVLQQAHYYPFGMAFTGLDLDADTNKFLYNGKELQTDGGLGWYDYGARFYDPALGRWHAIDPLAEDYLDWSPYNYVMNNPIMYVDPDGMSTHVIDNGDGTYKVVGGNLEDDDKGIYVVTQNEDGSYSDPGEQIGESLTMFSFYNEDEQDGEDQVGWKGTIDINSTESGDLVKDFIEEANDVGLVEYMVNATNGKDYDFKRDGDASNDDREFHHRGSLFSTKEDGTKVYASARDAGNYSAGYLAGSKKMTIGLARVGFNGFELLKSGHTEGRQSTQAQNLGWHRGYSKSTGQKPLIPLLPLK